MAWSDPARYTGSGANRRSYLTTNSTSGISWSPNSVSGYVAVVPQRRALPLPVMDPAVPFDPMLTVAHEDGVHITPWSRHLTTHPRALVIAARYVIAQIAHLVPPPFTVTDIYEAHLYPTWVGLGAYDASRTQRVQIELCPATGTTTTQAFPNTGAPTTWL